MNAMTEPIYILGQSLGILSTLCAIARPFCGKKQHILLLNIAVNALVAMNYVLIGQFGSGTLLCLVCVIQSLCSMGHLRRGTGAGTGEIALFSLLYLGFGIFGLLRAATPLPELLPIAGTVIMMIAIYIPDEQATRKLLLLNGILWTVYALSRGSSTFLTNAVSATAAGIALWRYRKIHKE